MPIDQALSQEDIDALFKAQTGGASSTPRAARALAYDFRRTDRIPKEQIRSLRAVHDTFARGLASSLSGYLRTNVAVNVISVEQLSFRDFVSCLPSPTCLSTVRISPIDAMAVLEMNPQLAFPFLELLLGGGKSKPSIVTREMTKIEERILDGLLVLVLQNLAFAWQSVAAVDFTIETHESEPALLQVMAPNEAVVTIATEIQVGENSGMMNLGIPSTAVKLLRQRTDQQWHVRRNAASEDESGKILDLVKPAGLKAEAMLAGGSISIEDLLCLRSGDVLQLECKSGEPIGLIVNGCSKFTGRVVGSGRKRAICVESTIDDDVRAR